MGNMDVLSGVIELVSGRKKSHLKFKMSVDIPSMDELLVCNFHWAQLPKMEKNILTFKDRFNIYCYTNVDIDEVKDYARKLTKKISGIKGRVRVKANGLGAFICLTAVVCKLIPQNKNISFELCDAPFSLFPEDIFQGGVKNPSFKIAFDFNDNDWVNKFKSLKRHNQFKMYSS